MNRQEYSDYLKNAPKTHYSIPEKYVVPCGVTAAYTVSGLLYGTLKLLEKGASLIGINASKVLGFEDRKKLFSENRKMTEPESFSLRNVKDYIHDAPKTNNKYVDGLNRHVFLPLTVVTAYGSILPCRAFRNAADHGFQSFYEADKGKIFRKKQDKLQNPRPR